MVTDSPGEQRRRFDRTGFQAEAWLKIGERIVFALQGYIETLTWLIIAPIMVSLALVPGPGYSR
jgi:hypothetical protein